MKIKAEAERLGKAIPYIAGENGRYTDTKECWWTNGFWAGILWHMYALTGDDFFMENARYSEERLDRYLDEFENIDHDAGFLWLYSAGADYTLTGNVRSKKRLLHAANVLAGRYNPDLKIIRAWDNPWMGEYDTAGGAIIDTMMNLPLLYLASEITGDGRFKRIAENHADTMLVNMLRPDGSSNHQIVFDVNTGKLIANPAGQGYASGSSWSRGQAWALYGYALSYRFTGEKRYLDAAKRQAAYFIANASLTGYVPLADFRAPEAPEYFDTTAGAAAACGMLEIAEHSSEYEKYLFVQNAKRLIFSLDKAWCDYDPDNDGILGGGSVSYHNEKHHEKIIYGDYYFIEAVMRLNGKNMIWL